MEVNDLTLQARRPLQDLWIAGPERGFQMQCRCHAEGTGKGEAAAGRVGPATAQALISRSRTSGRSTVRRRITAWPLVPTLW